MSYCRYRHGEVGVTLLLTGETILDLKYIGALDRAVIEEATGDACRCLITPAVLEFSGCAHKGPDSNSIRIKRQGQRHRPRRGRLTTRLGNGRDAAYTAKPNLEGCMCKLTSLCIAAALAAVLSAPIVVAQTINQGPGYQAPGTYSPYGNQPYGPQQQPYGFPSNGIPTNGVPSNGIPPSAIPTNRTQSYSQGQLGQPSTASQTYGNQTSEPNGMTSGNTANGNNSAMTQPFGNQNSITDQNGRTRTCQTFGNQTTCN
jgi:hypothetical protein